MTTQLFNVGILTPCLSDHRAQYINIFCDQMLYNYHSTYTRYITTNGMNNLNQSLRNIEWDILFRRNHDGHFLSNFSQGSDITKNANNIYCYKKTVKTTRKASYDNFITASSNLGKAC